MTLCALCLRPLPPQSWWRRLWDGPHYIHDRSDPVVALACLNGFRARLELPPLDALPPWVQSLNQKGTYR